MRRLIVLSSLACATAWAEPAPPRIEVAFVLDVTGSMQPWIDAARARIAGIASDLGSGDPRPEVRFALVEFRDKGDTFVTRVHPFAKDLQARLDAAHADGGGDTPEAVLEGLRDGIVKLDWSASDDKVMKLLYLVGDAPAQHYADSPTEAWIAAEAMKRGIVIHTIACGDIDAAGRDSFEALARLSEGRAYRLADRVGGTARLGATVSTSARAYSAAAGVKYDARAALAPVAAVPLALPPGGGAAPASGLLGAQLRVVSDERAWSDLLAAHESLGLRAPRLRVDFARSRVLALGGADAGLELVRLDRGDGASFATLRPASPGVRFVIVPADAGPVVAREVSP